MTGIINVLFAVLGLFAVAWLLGGKRLGGVKGESESKVNT